MEIDPVQDLHGRAFSSLRWSRETGLPQRFQASTGSISGFLFLVVLFRFDPSLEIEAKLKCVLFLRSTVKASRSLIHSSNITGLRPTLISFAGRPTFTILSNMRFRLSIGTNRLSTYDGFYHQCSHMPDFLRTEGVTCRSVALDNHRVVGVFGLSMALVDLLQGTMSETFENNVRDF
ncbi:hypothetical protein Ddye_005665 [Dipteronia dyeriana]|uniref:Uncharacterized protein n=1 Tax=Dipteronia dyeriana TaxID=168575 RepID=A0AAD9XH33_9ROSI|nr:hypothetical protein Ddye_005665 [Dipteronia dyeriana]